MPERLKDSLVRGLEAPGRGSRITYDSEVKGFGIRVTAAGTKAFVLNYRAEGRERRLTIGTYPSWPVAAAREEAKRLKRLVDLGQDPMAERHARRRAPTVAGLADLYEEEHLPRKRPKSQADDRSMLEHVILPKLGGMKVAQLRLADVEALHRSLRKTPTRANRVVALISKMFAVAIRHDWVDTNPARGVHKFPEEPRARYLNGDELQRLAVVLDELPNQTMANLVRLLLLTGARRSEVQEARWVQFDLEAGVWTKPSANVKQKREHRVPLSKHALVLLEEMKVVAKGEFLFPGKVAGQPVQDVRYWWDKIRQQAGLPGVRMHDLRHTYAAILASAGLGLPVIGALLGHTQAATTNRYVHLLDHPLREATETVGALFRAASEGAPDPEATKTES